MFNPHTNNLIPKNAHGCPYLFLAPMEGVGDQCFRKAMASVGGFDECVTEFIRVPSNAHVVSLAKVYEADETHPIPLAAQLMGSSPELMAAMAIEIEKRGAPRIDLNCGCPSNTVTGRGAGSSLLKTPDLLFSIASSMVKAVRIPVTLKMRSGYENTSLFEENLLAAQESGVRFLTLHPRTKVEGYGPPANWDLIARAKELLKIPVIGNGDILTVDDALRMLAHTRCDALMIGRGSVIDPFIFHKIKAHFSKTTYLPTWELLQHFIHTYIAHLYPESSVRNQINKVKQLFSYLFKGSAPLLAERQRMLTTTADSLLGYTNAVLPILQKALQEV